MIKLTESAKILQDTYLSLLNKELKQPSGKRIVCCKCGKGNTTLRKLPDGQYICNSCWKEQTK